MKHRGHIASVARRAIIAFLCALAVALLPACGSSGDSGSSGNSANSSVSSDSAPSGAAFSQPSKVTLPKKSKSGIDTKNVNKGYVSVSASSPARLKFQMTCNEETYNFDLPNDGTSTTYPINMGNGSYRFRIMQNTSGSNYVELDSKTAKVKLKSEFDPFLLPNMFCDYNDKSSCVSKARELTASSGNLGQAVHDICTYVAQSTTYDNAKAEELSQSTGYIPDPDDTLKSNTGICFDYASLSAAMLRSMGIPTKLVTGYVGADELYHAWIMVYIDGTWQEAQFTVSPNEWSRCDVTFASTGATKYVGDASAYIDRYIY